MTRYSTGWKQPANTYSEVRGTKLRETDKAYHLKITTVSGSPVRAVTVWIPISQTQKSIYDPVNASWVGLIADWILEKNNIEVDSDPEADPGDNTPEAYDPYDDDIPF